jgi:hypothetical protein
VATRCVRISPPPNTPGECDLNSQYPCCSPYGYCGDTAAHCECHDCIDYRTPRTDVQVTAEAGIVVGVDLAACAAPVALAAGLDRVTTSVSDMFARHEHIAAVRLVGLGPHADGRALLLCAGDTLPPLVALALARCLVLSPSCTRPVDALPSCATQLHLDPAPLLQCASNETMRSGLAAASPPPPPPLADDGWSSCGVAVSVTGALARSFTNAVGDVSDTRSIAIVW